MHSFIHDCSAIDCFNISKRCVMQGKIDPCLAVGSWSWEVPSEWPSISCDRLVLLADFDSA